MTDKIVFYNIELEHLNDLKAVANRLLRARARVGTPHHMNALDLEDAAVKILTAVNYAEVLHTFRNSGKPVCRICGPFLLDSCPAAPRHDLRTPEEP